MALLVPGGRWVGTMADVGGRVREGKPPKLWSKLGHDFQTPATGAVDLDGFAAIPPTPWGKNVSNYQAQKAPKVSRRVLSKFRNRSPGWRRCDNQRMWGWFGWFGTSRRALEAASFTFFFVTFRSATLGPQSESGVITKHFLGRKLFALAPPTKATGGLKALRL